MVNPASLKRCGCSSWLSESTRSNADEQRTCAPRHPSDENRHKYNNRTHNLCKYSSLTCSSHWTVSQAQKIPWCFIGEIERNLKNYDMHERKKLSLLTASEWERCYWPLKAELIGYRNARAMLANYFTTAQSAVRIKALRINSLHFIGRHVY
jgi:hypothetical protein